MTSLCLPLTRSGALAAVLMCLVAQTAAAEGPRPESCTAAGMATPAAWSRPAEGDTAVDWAYAAFRGLSCSRCNSATQYCVLNPVRYEYACAPLGTVACVSAERTAWCPPGQSCWAGRCR